jgi:hypothetical protein
MGKWWPWLPLLLGAYLALSVLVYWAYTSKLNAVADFYIEWEGSRVALAGGNPYSRETTELIQLTSKGHLTEPGEDQLAFADPFYRVFLNAPLANLPYAWASAFWLGFMFVCLLTGLYFTLAALNWRPRLYEFFTVGAAWIFTYSTFGAAMLGQIAVVVLALLCAAWWATSRGRPVLAGVALAIATTKPQLVALVVPVAVLWWLRQRQWSAIGSFVLSVAALAGASFLILPTWLSEFWRVLTQYPSYKDVRTGPDYLFAQWGTGGQILSWAVWVALALWLASAWWQVRSERSPSFAGAVTLTMALTCVLLPQTSIVNSLLCLPALVLVLRDIPRRTKPQRALWLASCLAVLVIPWLSYFAFYSPNYGLAMALQPMLATLALAIWNLALRPSCQPESPRHPWPRDLPECR